MSDKWYVIFYISICLKLFIAAADSSFVQYCIEMPIVWHRILRKFLRLALETATDRYSVK